MIRLLRERLILAAITLLLVSIGVFALSDLLPGDVGRTILGQYASPAQVAQLNHELGVDQPLPVRYWRWISGFVVGDWGESYLLKVPILPLVIERLCNSAILGGFAAFIIVPFSIALGVVAALHRDRALDHLISVIGLSLIGIPEFVGGVFVLVAFAVKLGWFPVLSEVPTSLNPVEWFHQLFLPSLPLMFVLFGYISRMARAGTVECLQANYTRTAVLKGLPWRVVIWRHVLRNSLVPTVSVVAVQVGGLLGGLVVVETVFTYPGLGKLLLNSAVGHDLPMLTACVLVTAVIYMAANLIADAIAAFLNPRIRVAAQ